MSADTYIVPFDNCPALDGYHCQSNSLAKLFHYHRHPLSEDMILGLGCGMGFIYWKMKIEQGISVFIGGRGNNKDFFTDLGRRTGVDINVISTTSRKKAESSLLEMLEGEMPVMLFGDMGFLPWFDFPEGYHFGGHTFVVCGYDGENRVLASDIDPEVSGLKKGFFYPISLEQLSKARGSTYKPFPPKNTYLQFDFSSFHFPTASDIYASIKQTVDSMLNPPIKNIGVKGMRHASREILTWPKLFNDYDLRMNLFNLYIFLEIGGTGGGCFRYMYSCFLKEAAKITKNNALLQTSEMINSAGTLFTETALLFQEAESIKDIQGRIEKASSLLEHIAGIEEEAYNLLSHSIA
jgi:hypothetical protein